jgi:hypothetical protein
MRAASLSQAIARSSSVKKKKLFFPNKKYWLLPLFELFLRKKIGKM